MGGNGPRGSHETQATNGAKAAKSRDGAFALLEYLGTHEVGWVRLESTEGDETFERDVPPPKKPKDKELHDVALLEAAKVRLGAGQG